MKAVDVHEAMARLSELLALVEQGEDVLIARDGHPVARLTAAPPIRREPGELRRLPAWREFRFDPAVFARMSDADIAKEGWP